MCGRKWPPVGRCGGFHVARRSLAALGQESPLPTQVFADLRGRWGLWRWAGGAEAEAGGRRGEQDRKAQWEGALRRGVWTETQKGVQTPVCRLPECGLGVWSPASKKLADPARELWEGKNPQNREPAAFGWGHRLGRVGGSALSGDGTLSGQQAPSHLPADLGPSKWDLAGTGRKLLCEGVLNP